VRKEMQTLYLIRGLPGSGKSTLAKTLSAKHVEADMFFIKDDQYQFTFSLLGKAHEWCQNQVNYYLSQGYDVVVSNTFIRKWEMTCYEKLAKKHNAELVVKVCRGKYKNRHNVPLETLNQMRMSWEE